MRLLTLKEVQNLLLEVMIEVDGFCKQKNIKYYMLGGTLLGAVRHKGFIPWDDDIDIGMLRGDYERFLQSATEKQWKYELVNYRLKKNCDYVITRLYIPDTYIDNPEIEKTKLDKRLYFDIFPLDYMPKEPKTQKKQARKLLNLKREIAYADVRIRKNNSKFDVILKKILAHVISPFRQALLFKLEKTMQTYPPCGYVCSMASQYSYEKQSFEELIYGKPVPYIFEGYTFAGPAKCHEYLTQLYGADYMELPPVEKRRKGYDIYIKES